MSDLINLGDEISEQNKNTINVQQINGQEQFQQQNSARIQAQQSPKDLGDNSNYSQNEGQHSLGNLNGFIPKLSQEYQEVNLIQSSSQRQEIQIQSQFDQQSHQNGFQEHSNQDLLRTPTNLDNQKSSPQVENEIMNVDEQIISAQYQENLNRNEEEKTQTVLQVEKVTIYSQHEVQLNRITKEEDEQQKLQLLQQQEQQLQHQHSKDLRQQQYGGLVTPSARVSGHYMDDKSPTNSQKGNTTRSQQQQQQANFENFQVEEYHYENQNQEYYPASPKQITRKEKINIHNYANERDQGRSDHKDGNLLNKAQYIHSLAYYDPQVNSKKLRKRIAGQDEGNDISLQELINQNQYSLASSVNINNSTSNYSSTKKQKPKNVSQSTALAAGNLYSLQEKVEDRLLKMAHRKEEKLELMRKERDLQFIVLSQGKPLENNSQKNRYLAYQNHQSLLQQSICRNENNSSLGASYEAFPPSKQNIEQIGGPQQYPMQIYNQHELQQKQANSQNQNLLDSSVGNDYFTQSALQTQQQNQHRHSTGQISEAFQRLTSKKSLKYQFKPNIFSASQTSFTVNRRDNIKKNYLQKTKEIHLENTQLYQMAQQKQLHQQSPYIQTDSDENVKNHSQFKINNANSQSILSNSSSPRALMFKRQTVQDSMQINESTNQSKQGNLKQQYFSPEKYPQNEYDQQMKMNKNKVITNLFDSAERVKYQQQQELESIQSQSQSQQQQLYHNSIHHTPKQLNCNADKSLNHTTSKEFSFTQTGINNNSIHNINNQSSNDKMIFYGDKVSDLKYLQNFSPNFKAKYGAKYIPQSAMNDCNYQDYIRKITLETKKNPISGYDQSLLNNYRIN